MRESVIEKYLVEQVKAIGGEVRKVKWIGRRGAPDRLAMLPLGESRKAHCDQGGVTFYSWNKIAPQTVWVELKAPGEVPEPHQLREHTRMRNVGQIVVVIDSLEGVDELLRAYK